MPRSNNQLPDPALSSTATSLTPTTDPTMTRGQATDSARRRLMRGALAAPAILPLYSGSAFAATSANCLNGLDMSASPGISSSTDTWVRVQVYQNTSTATGTSITEKWVRGRDVAGLRLGKASVSSFISEGQWMKLVDGGPISNDVPSPEPTPISEYVAIRVDTATGSIVGISGYSSGAGAAVPGTCWSSFLGKP